MKRNHQSRAADDTLNALLDSLGSFLFFAGLVVTTLLTGVLVFYYFKFGDGGEVPAQALNNVTTLGKIMLPGAIALGIGAAFRFWGEEVLGVLLLIGGGILYMGPLLLGMAGSNSNKISQSAAQTLVTPGLVLVVIGAVCAGIELIQRIQMRSQLGAKSDTMKYGKGIKEERETQNVLLGKCWQLPYCRKFVREVCPIFHKKSTCWKERLGCMCEEQVIKAAMEKGTMSKEALATTKYVPKSNLTPNQKAERCRQCVIYNERQRHKYKIALPLVLIGMTTIYVVNRVALRDLIAGAISKGQGAANSVLLRANDSSSQLTIGFQEVLLVAVFLIAIAYLLKLAEYIIFTLKL